MSRVGVGQRRGRTAGPGDRGISTSLSHVFGLAITSVLLVSVIVTASGYVDDRRAAVAEQQLATVGDQLASEVHRVDALAARGGDVSIRTTLPASVSGEGYSVALADGPECRTGALDAGECLVLSIEGMDVTQRVPVNVSTDVALESEGGGEFVVSSSGGAGGATAADDVAAVTDRELRIGVGREFTVDDHGRVASPINRAPVAAFTFDPAFPINGTDITFNASDSRDPDGSITAYEWDFDGAGNASGKTVSRTFAAGTHDVTLSVYDNEDGWSNVTRTLRVSGLRYNGDLRTDGGGDVVTFSATNAWASDVNITQVSVDPSDDTIHEVNRDDGPLAIDRDGNGIEDEQVVFDHTTFADGGIIERLNSRLNVSSGETVDVSLGEFSKSMDAKEVTIGLRYEVNGETHSTVFTDYVGPSIERFELQSDPDDSTEVDLVLESTADLSTFTVDLGGTAAGTAHRSDFSYDGQTAEGHYRYVYEDVNAGHSGVVEANLTSAEGPTGIESRQTADGTINRSTVVVDPSEEYTWTTAADWDASSDRGIVHDSYGDRADNVIELGYERTDGGGDGLVGYWSFDGTADDASAENNDGTTENGPSVDLGVFGTRAYQFDGDDDYVELSEDLSDTHEDTSSLSFWIRTTNTGSSNPWSAPGVAGIEQAGGNEDIFWGWIDNGGRIGLQAGDGSSVKSGWIADGSWHHVVMTYDDSDGDARVYVDGTEFDSPDTAAIDDVAESFSSLGRIEDTGGTPEHFDGSLDEVRAYDRELTEDDVERLYNASRNGTLTTDWQSGASIDGGDLALEYSASVPSSTRINVTVLADADGDGTVDEESDVIELSDGDTQVPVTGLSGAADRYRLQIELESDSTLKSPTLRGVSLTEASP